MDIPIRFKFFDKLKLYQDYLKKDSMLEKTKSEYWLCEKAILLWAYSDEHKHLGVPLSAETFTERAETIIEGATRIGQDSTNLIRWVKKYAKSQQAMERVVEGLRTLEFTAEHPNQAGGLVINLKGFLLGELLFETYQHPTFWTKNYRKYKLALLAFYTAFIALFLTVFLVFFDLLFKFVGPPVIAKMIKELFSYPWWAPALTVFILVLGFRKIWQNL